MPHEKAHALALRIITGTVRVDGSEQCSLGLSAGVRQRALTASTGSAVPQQLKPARYQPS